MCRSYLTRSTKRTTSARSKVCRTRLMVKVVWLIQRLLQLEASGTLKDLKGRTSPWSRKRTTTSSVSWRRAKLPCNQTVGFKNTRIELACQREDTQWAWCQGWPQVQPLWDRLQLALAFMTRRWVHTRVCATHLEVVKAHTPRDQYQYGAAWKTTSRLVVRLVYNILT